jgi:superfamily II DNA or RNA helicase
MGDLFSAYPEIIGLKTYQRESLDTLRAFCETTRKLRVAGMADAVAMAFNKHKPNGLPDWQPLLDQRDVPFVCLRLPTGGGKTLVAAHSLGLIYDELLQDKDETGIVLWLTPSDTIRAQALEALSDERHPYRKVIDACFRNPNKPVQVLDNTRALDLKRMDVEQGLTIIVATMQAFKRENSEGLKAYKDRGPLYAHFSRQEQDDETLEKSLVEVIRRHRPLIVLDEGHNAKTELSLEMVAKFTPSFVLELTATPHDFSNVLVRVSAQALKAEQMVKLPVRLENHPHWEDTLRLAVEKRAELERLAAVEQKATGEYLRPILLIQAERDKADAGKLHVDLIKTHLMETHGIPEQQIAIKTGTTDELARVELMAEHCPVRFILTRDALREGWDCPFAYVLASVFKTSARLAIEQLLGRVLRLPNAKTKRNAALNKAYVYVSEAVFDTALRAVLAGMQNHGFERGDIQRPDQPDDLPMQAQFTALTFPLIAIRDGKNARSLDYLRDVIGGRLDFKGAPLDLADLGALRGKSVEIDVDDKSSTGLSVRNHNEADMLTAFDLDEDEDTARQQLVRWLLGRLPNLDEVAQSDLGAWVEEAVAVGIKAYGLEGLLVRKYHLAARLRGLFDAYYLDTAKRGFAALENGGVLTASAVVHYALPERQTIADVSKSYSYQHSVFERVDNLNNEERALANALDTMPEIAWWQRNARPRRVRLEILASAYLQSGFSGPARQWGGYPA